MDSLRDGNEGRKIACRQVTVVIEGVQDVILLWYLSVYQGKIVILLLILPSYRYSRKLFSISALAEHSMFGETSHNFRGRIAAAKN